MGIQTMNSHGCGQQSHLQPLGRQNSWFSLTLDEVESLLGNLGKPLGSMNLDELLTSIWATEANQSSGPVVNNAYSTSLQRQASFSLTQAFSGKTVDEVWKDIQQGQKMRNLEEMNTDEREPTLGETTLEDFLVKAGLFVVDSSQGPAMTPQNVTPQLGLSPSPSIEALSDTPTSGWKRDASEIDRTVDRRLRRKIKNRESAARSRARKQAYHNELVNKVSRLEEENMKLKKEKELDKMLSDVSSETRYQLRRTSSF
ncbi:PREDICTED: ABSCISIC ACID-INSENSITIVE 5-like protein 2 [Ipomoea nil]|uniref:ABSCISIC ACID-INSENSITIVE 5-like protein 2 n=1 Tax=Ipomoea nil TaxID=35883 RepID=UPI000901D7BE|nr:PREDICTED: ABSCISIC ACID-INSENSITIVE 5-like protein 2 [Ipomoea nil]XP_019163357.1 PREDICTED: ABSCISIC ACID-INSENSITIVE 5-like protein 2 [Ipomoea nil]